VFNHPPGWGDRAPGKGGKRSPKKHACTSHFQMLKKKRKGAISPKKRNFAKSGKANASPERRSRIGKNGVVPTGGEKLGGGGRGTDRKGES